MCVHVSQFSTQLNTKSPACWKLFWQPRGLNIICCTSATQVVVLWLPVPLIHNGVKQVVV